MNVTIPSGPRHGTLTVPASKSWAHRILITAALSAKNSRIICDGISKDITATMDCLNALGANITAKLRDDGCTELLVTPIKITVDHSDSTALYAPLLCKESGSTLRFLIPVVGALGKDAVFHMEGRLSERPIDALTDVLKEHGMSFMQDGKYLYCRGKLTAGHFSIPGNISSQYISGLLMATPLLDSASDIEITGNIESGDYINMTAHAVRTAGVELTQNENIYHIEPKGRFSVSGDLIVEKDWSSAAFPLCMGAFSKEGITVTGLNTDSIQGDKEILNILKGFGADISTTREQGCDAPENAILQPDGMLYKPSAENGLCSITVKRGSLKGQTIDASRIPDLVPVISVVAAGALGETRIIHAERLRIKESDRLFTTATMLKNLGADIEETEDGLIIKGKETLTGGTTEAFNDHRIAMSAAVAAGISTGPVTVLGAECTDKSFPGFWEELL